MTPATRFLHTLDGLPGAEIEHAIAAEAVRTFGHYHPGMPARLCLHGIDVTATTAAEARRKWRQIARHRETVETDMALAERVLHQPGTDRATLHWACGTILQHSRDAWLRTAAEAAMPKEELAA